MSTPHELPEAFPEHADLIHRLKTADRHFQKLASDYDEVNDQVHRAETNLSPTDDFHEEALRKKRLALLDEISAYLRKRAAEGA